MSHRILYFASFNLILYVIGLKKARTAIQWPLRLL